MFVGHYTYLKQQDTLFGVLSKQDAANIAQAMSTAFNENSVSSSPSLLTFNEPISRRSIKITSQSPTASNTDA